MKKRTREDKKRASENRITYLSKVTKQEKVTPQVNYREYSSNRDLIKSLVVSLLMFGLLYALYTYWR